MERNNSVDLFASLSLSDVLRSLWRYRASIVSTTFGLAILLAVVVYLLPVKYDSQAQLLVRLGRNTLASDPTSSATPNVSVQETRLSQVSSVKEMLQSRALAEQVVGQIGAERILEPHGFVETTLKQLTDKVIALLPRTGGAVSGTSDSGELSAEAAAAHLQKEEAIAKLQSNLDFTTTKSAYTVSIRARSGSPYLSRDILAALIERYHAYHIQAFSSEGALTFFETQSSEAYDDAVASKEKVRLAKNKMGVIEIDAARVALREQLSQAQREFDQVEVDLAATGSEVERYEQQMASLPERINAEVISGITSNTSDGMRQQLYQLEVQAKELAAKFQEDHPQLRAVRDQLEAARKIAQSEKKDQPQSREAFNPVFQQLELAYRNSLVKQDGLKARRESLKNHLKDLDAKIYALNENEVELTKLSWQATLAENVYLQNAQNRDKAKLLEALDREGLSEISVVQPASFQLKKASPKRGILFVAAALLACGLGVLQALVRTVVNDSPQAVITRREPVIHEELELPATRPIAARHNEAKAWREVSESHS